ncbi:hypothetical protein RISK_006535 [Rhodopirellula islandica]|uniref:Uncharacterized protein n=1 Tax=Rhodopirellula islandica TaxID=595434 RepID=A0A0J1E7F0_RHOIS|nr:hypothetical protein RISK_006535 [Rhodopirellula islandica]
MFTATIKGGTTLVLTTSLSGNSHRHQSISVSHTGLCTALATLFVFT